jgi:hypothetical protein
MKNQTPPAPTEIDNRLGSTVSLGSFLLQVKADGKGRWKTIRKHPDAEYLKLVGDRHFARFEKRRIISA